MPNLGFGELVLVFLIVLLVFGASRLPQIGEGVGKAIRGFKRGIGGDDEIDVTPKETQQMRAESSAEKIDQVEAKDPAAKS